jgi:hypothetical protein
MDVSSCPGWTRLNVDQWCCLRFRFAAVKRSTSFARLCPARAEAPYWPAHYESVDEWFQRVHSRPDQDPMFAWGPGRTGLNGIQLQPRVQPLGPDRDVAGYPGARITKYASI